MKISMEVGVKTPKDPKKWTMVPHLLFFFEDPGFSESKLFSGRGAESAGSAASRPARWFTMVNDLLC